MAGGFDAELRASIRDLQSAVAALSTETTKANQTLRQTQAEVKGVAAVHREAAIAAGGHAREAGGVAEQIHGIGRAARLAGGEGSSLVGHLSHLVSINPLAIAAGVGIGFITNQITELIAHAKDGSKALEELLKKPEELAQKIAGLAHAGEAAIDSKGLRKGAVDRYLGGDENLDGFDDDIKERVYQAARNAVKAGRAGSVDEGIGRIRKSGAARKRASGMGLPTIQVTDDQLLAVAADSDRADFGDAFRRAQGTSDYQLAEDADITKAGIAAAASEKTRAQAGLGTDPRIAGILTEIRNLLAKRNAAIESGDQGGAIAAEAQAQERTAQLDSALSNYATTSK